jgi:hypothetical protein
MCQPSPIHEASSKGTIGGLPLQDMCVILSLHCEVLKYSGCNLSMFPPSILR